MIEQLPDIAILATPLYVVIIALELGLVHRGKVAGDYETRDASASLLVGLGSVVMGLATTLSLGIVVLLSFEWVAQYRLIEIPVTWWAFGLCFLLDDFRYYWSHRLSHTVRWCWASHVVHHSSQHFNFTTALRQPWVDVLTGLFLLKLPLIWLGFDPAIVIFVASLNLFYQFFVHTEAIDRLPYWVEAVFNTPSHHRVHHGRNLRYLDANYAGVFIVWDKWFGTFVPEYHPEPVEYGLVKNIATFNPIRVAFHGYVELLQDLFQPGLGWPDRLKYLWRPPGWRHDGHGQVTSDRKRNFLRENPQLLGQPGFPSSLIR